MPSQIHLVPKRFSPDPPDSKYLWRLMRFSELYQLETLVRGGLWFSRIDAFRDCLEGTLPKGNLGLLEKLLPAEMSEHTVREYERTARRVYASCWTMSDGDPSQEMWDAQFGNRGKGIAIKSTACALLEATKSIRGEDGPLYLGRIRYINHEDDIIPEAQTLEAGFVVQDKFRFQKEARLLIHSYGNNAASILARTNSIWGKPLVRYLTKEQSDTGVMEFEGLVPGSAEGRAKEQDGKAIALPVDPSQIIQEVLIGSRVSDEEAESVKTVLKEAGLEALARRAHGKMGEKS